LKTNKHSLSHAVVCLCNWQRSNIKKNKNPDKPPVVENLPGRPDRAQKEDMSGETRTYGNRTPAAVAAVDHGTDGRSTVT